MNIYLYVKTHNVTGLKYLGKTTGDPFTYKGSGKYWKRHIKKHGYDVTTEIIFQTNDKEEFKRFSTEYSIKYNIVESQEWANLTLESGDGGLTYYPTEDQIKYAIETKRKNGTLKNAGSKESRLKARITTLERHGTLKTGDNETRIKGWETRRKNGTDKGYTKRKTAKSSNAWNVRKQNGTHTWKIQEQVTCPHCNKTGSNSGAMYQWHFDNCKLGPKGTKIFSE